MLVLGKKSFAELISTHGLAAIFRLGQFWLNLATSDTPRRPETGEQLPSLDEDQRAAYQLAVRNIDSGGVVLILGGPGCGKSNVIHHLRRDFGESLLTSAPTGTASYAVHGQTLNALFSVPIDEEDFTTLTGVAETRLYERLRQIKMLIIDEVSMVSSQMFDKVLRRISEVRPGNAIRIVLFGDFFQLRCIGGTPIYEHELLRQCPVAFCTRVHRQQDPVFLDILQKIKTGSMDSAAFDILKSNCFSTSRPDDYATYKQERVMHITGTNREVDAINFERFMQYLRSQPAEQQSPVVRTNSWGKRFPLLLIFS